MSSPSHHPSCSPHCVRRLWRLPLPLRLLSLSGRLCMQMQLSLQSMLATAMQVGHGKRLHMQLHAATADDRPVAAAAAVEQTEL